MEKDSIPQQFQKLEEKVGQLVQTCQDLQQSEVALKAKVRELEEALKTQDASSQHYMEEKTMIRSKIDNLVSRLEQALDSG